MSDRLASNLATAERSPTTLPRFDENGPAATDPAALPRTGDAADHRLAPPPDGGMPPSLPRMTHLDGLRFFAFLGVFLFHSLNAPLLWTGVDCFFVLSGYLISGILLRSRNDARYFRNFYRRRFLRIFPPYYLFLLFVFLAAASHQEGRSAAFFFLYASNINSAFELLPYPPALTAMWSLAIEEQFYIVWPFIVRNLRESALSRLCFALLFVSPLCRFFTTLTSDNHCPTYYLTPCRIDLLAAGTLLALAERRLSATRFLRLSTYGLGLSLLSLLIFSALAFLDPSFRTSANSVLFNTVGYSLVVLMMMGFLGWLIPRRHGLLGRTLSWKPFVYLGVISYGLYMYHELVLQQVSKFGIGTWLTSGIGLTGTVLVAAASWHLVEKPLQKFKTSSQPVLSNLVA